MGLVSLFAQCYAVALVWDGHFQAVPTVKLIHHATKDLRGHVRTLIYSIVVNKMFPYRSRTTRVAR